MKKFISRFIPVYTGNIRDIPSNETVFSVYPCVYREHKSVGRSITVISGLSLCIQGT